MSKSFKSFISTTQKVTDQKQPISCRSKLQGEVDSIVCDNVSYCFQFEEEIHGRITCSNFSLYFSPYQPTREPVMARSTVIDERFCIPLCSIQHIYYSSIHQNLHQSVSKKKYHLFEESVSSMEIVSCLKLFLKDFRVLTIDLTKAQHAPNMANQLLCFSRPSSIDNIIQAGAEYSWNMRIDFNDEQSWSNEMTRCGISKNEWRVCQVQKELTHRVIYSFPKYVVVPSLIGANELGSMIEHWNQGRFPVWVWSSSRKVHLLRSAIFDRNYTSENLYHRYCSYIATEDNVPREIVIDPQMDAEKVAASFQKLHKMCSIDSYEMFHAREKTWLTRFHDSGWPQLVLTCMQYANEAVEWIELRHQSILLLEKTGYDISAVVSCLVQICCDPFCRNSQGLEMLIAKEWISLGHPFGNRNLCIGNAPPSQGGLSTAPVFLLFLDCVAQLIRIYPMQFNYSEHLLIALWDLAITGFVPAFVCSSIEEQLSKSKTGGPFPLSRFYTEEYRSLFSNVVNDAAQVVTEKSKKTKQTAITGLLRDSNATSMMATVLRPPTTMADIELWNLCYLRWVKPANVATGGEIYSNIAIDDLMQQACNRSNRIWKPQYGLVSGDSKLSSAYPYSEPEADQWKQPPVPTEEFNDSYSFASLSLHDDLPPRRESYGYESPIIPSRTAPQPPRSDASPRHFYH